MNNSENTNSFMNIIKAIISLAPYIFIIGFIIFLILCMFCANKLNNSNLAIVQSFGGVVEVRRASGWWWQFCPTKWIYSKASLEICSVDEKDAIPLQFSNKSRADLNCQVGYRIDGATDDQILRLHQFAEGEDEKIWQKVYTKLLTVAQCVASQYTPSESIEKFDEFTKKIHDAILHEEELFKEGIDISFFDCAGLPKYDKQTEDQFARQKEADLAKRLAEAEKIRLESETLKTKANYEREIAEFKGKADAETAKLVTEAERQAKLATIEAQKRVDVETLAKQEAKVKADKEKEVATIEVEKQKEVARIEAEKLFTVAEIQKKTEAENLEAIKLQSEQKIAAAQAKKQEIELSGAITELQKAELELQRSIAEYKWNAIGKGISGIQLPQMMNLTTGTGNGETIANPLNDLIKVITMEKLENVTTPGLTK